MRRIWVVAILGLGISAFAQHSSGGHASSSGGGSHFSGGPSGSGYAPRSSSPGSAPRYAGPRSYAPRSSAAHGRPPIERPGYAIGPHSQPAYGRPSVGTRSATNANAHSASSRPAFNGHRPGNGIRIYAAGPISPLGWWLGPYQFYPWLDADLSYDFWHDTGDTEDAIAMASTGANEVADTEPQPWPNGGDPYSDQMPDPNAPAGWTASQVDTGAPALTLVYKSGQTEQVANYVVSASAVTVIDAAGVRSVPVAELDVPAMAKVNAQAGLQLPQGLQP